MNPYKKLASALVAHAAVSIRSTQPKRFTKEQDADYRKRIADWKAQKQNDIEWFENPARSAMWIEAAGLTWEGVTAGLRRRGRLPQSRNVA